MKNWSGRNEVVETSGSLHPLRPQNKRLHTPRTTDHRNIRQDRRIQTELASTLAKNATKPNTFEIIQLQTRGKDNNWKTEETLARAAVTLKMERIKGSNSWCLWWWWWWWILELKEKKLLANFEDLGPLNDSNSVWPAVRTGTIPSTCTCLMHGSVETTVDKLHTLIVVQ